MIQVSSFLWRQFALDLASRLPFGVVLTDGHARVRHMNHRAAMLIAGQRGLRMIDGRIMAASPPVDAKLQMAIARAHGTGRERSGSQFAAPVPGMHRAIHMVVTSMLSGAEPGEAGEETAVVLFLFGPDQVAIDAKVLAAIYGLTSAEARVAARMVAGERPARIGAAIGSTLNTVRTHVRRVFTKSGCRSQAEFVLAVLTGPALLASPELVMPHLDW
jgi:DNA-binding CsgD family transcriptional regulator